MTRRLGIRWAFIALVLVLVAGVAGQAAAFTRTANPGPVLNQGQTFALTTQEQQITATSRKVDQEVVQVENVGVGLGSGVIASSDGYIVTNNHVVAGGSTYFVTLWNGKRLSAKLIGTSVSDDLAVIKVTQTGLPAARFANSDKLMVGQSALAVGNPLGLGETVTLGVISAVSRTVSEQNGAYIPNAIQTSAPINPGNSGGALASLDGQIVGIPTLAASSPEGGAASGIGFAIPSNRVIAIADQLISTGHVTHTGRAFLGIAIQDVSTASNGSNGSSGSQVPQPSQPTATGVLVTATSANGPAAKAGIKAGDLLVSVAGQPVASSDNLFAILANLKVGQKVPVVVERAASNNSTSVTKVTVTVTLGELPANQ